MKRDLLVLLLPMMFLFNRCEKEKLFGEYDLNNDGKEEEVLEIKADKKYSFFYLKDRDTNYIARFSKKPDLTGFYDFKNDGYLDFWYNESKGDQFKTFIFDNENGIFSKEERELGQ